MVEVVVLDGKLHVAQAKELAENGVPPDGANARVTECLYVQGVDDEEVEFDERELWGNGSGEEWNDENLEAFLNVVGQDGQDRGWVLGGVVLTVDEPEAVKLVRRSVVEVEPVVE